MEEHRLALPSGVLERKTGIPAAISSAVGLDWIARNVVLPPVSLEIEVRPLSRFGTEFDTWGERVVSEYKFALVRDRNYLSWRYTDGPAPYRTWAAYRREGLSGFITTFEFTSRPAGFILDLTTEPGDAEAAGSLLRVAVAEMLRAGANEIFASTASQSLSCDATGPIRKACPLRGGAFRPFVARWLGKRQPFPADGWHLVMGDFDGI